MLPSHYFKVFKSLFIMFLNTELGTYLDLLLCGSFTSLLYWWELQIFHNSFHGTIILKKTISAGKLTRFLLCWMCLNLHGLNLNIYALICLPLFCFQAMDISKMCIFLLVFTSVKNYQMFVFWFWFNLYSCSICWCTIMQRAHC